MQKQATEQIQKAGKKAETTASADYSGADVHTLTPHDLKKVSVEDQVNRFGVGLLEIPAISLKLPILEGITQANLSVGVGTAKPDQQLKKGNFVLLGHYMTDQGLLFGGIHLLKKGDIVKVSYKSEQAEYEVVSTKVIDKHEVRYLEDPKNDLKILTMVTCDSSNRETPNRLIVQAKLKS